MNEQKRPTLTGNLSGHGETVTVACKLPHGIKMRLFRIEEIDIPIMGGGVKTVKESRPREDAPTYTLCGFSHPQNAAPEHPIMGGYALTYGIPKDFFDEWLSQNKDSDIVRNHLVFAHTREADTVAEAREKASLKSGLERLDPDNLPAPFKGKIKTEKRAA